MIPLSFIQPNLYAILENEYPKLPIGIINETDLTMLSDHELWSILAAIKLQENLTSIDVENRRRCRDELCSRHPKLVCPVCDRPFSNYTKEAMVLT